MIIYIRRDQLHLGLFPILLRWTVAIPLFLFFYFKISFPMDLKTFTLFRVLFYILQHESWRPIRRRCFISVENLKCDMLYLFPLQKKMYGLPVGSWGNSKIFYTCYLVKTKHFLLYKTPGFYTQKWQTKKKFLERKMFSIKQVSKSIIWLTEKPLYKFSPLIRQPLQIDRKLYLYENLFANHAEI